MMNRRVLGQPGLDLRMAGGAVVVHEEVQDQVLVRIAVDQLEELRPFFISVAGPPGAA